MNRTLLVSLGLALATPFSACAGKLDRTETNAEADAYTAVKSAETFALGGIGVAGTISQQEIAFRQLLKEPEPLARCQRLLTEATPAGQIYALLGLRLLDAKAFAAAVPHYLASQAAIPTIRGCIMMKMPAAKLATEIQKGDLK